MTKQELIKAREALYDLVDTIDVGAIMRDFRDEYVGAISSFLSCRLRESSPAARELASQSTFYIGRFGEVQLAEDVHWDEKPVQEDFEEPVGLVEYSIRTTKDSTYTDRGFYEVQVTYHVRSGSLRDKAGGRP